MNIYKAHKITKGYRYSTLNGKHSAIPRILTNVTIVKNRGEKRHYIFGDYIKEDNDDRTIITSCMFKRSSSKEYKKINLEIKSPNGPVEYKEFPENMCLCSIGLVSEEDFYLAEDIIKSFTKVREKDLVFEEKYRAINNKEYIFIGNSKLREVKSGKAVKFSSQKLIPLDSIWNEEC